MRHAPYIDTHTLTEKYISNENLVKPKNKNLVKSEISYGLFIPMK